MEKDNERERQSERERDTEMETFIYIYILHICIRREHGMNGQTDRHQWIDRYSFWKHDFT